MNLVHELARRQRSCARVVAYFRARPYQRITVPELEQIGGRASWRTRVSEARTYVFEPEGGTLKNERDDQVIDGVVHIHSFYVYRPQKPLGREAAQIVSQPGLF